MGKSNKRNLNTSQSNLLKKALFQMINFVVYIDLPSHFSSRSLGSSLIPNEDSHGQTLMDLLQQKTEIQ